MTAISFTVRGTPVPQGSVRAFVAGGRARVATKTPNLMAWRTAIATAAAAAMGSRPAHDGPVVIDATFWLPRPSSAPRRVVYPARKPDVDKLARALLDGMTGIVFRDDALVVDLVVRKRFDVVEPTGVTVTVEEAPR